MKDYREKEIKYLYLLYVLLFLYWSTSAFPKLAQNTGGTWSNILSIVDVVAIAGIISLLL